MSSLLEMQSLFRYMEKICTTDEDIIKVKALNSNYYRLLKELSDTHLSAIEFKTELEGKYSKIVINHES